MRIVVNETGHGTCTVAFDAPASARIHSPPPSVSCCPLPAKIPSAFEPLM
ncbi:MAG: hypothetical protein DWI22_12620 [Planctomycetota bacterium]|nr:MAG: hypothetical protein DWI22_12620 [Planctomycetota bacterium]